MRCLTHEELLRHRMGLAPDTAEHAGHAEHIGGCAPCTGRIELLDRLLAGLSEGPLPDVPEHLVQAAKAIPRSAAPAAPGPLARVRELIAKKLVDTASFGLAPALRGSEEGGPVDRHLLYAADSFEVDLAVVEGGSLVGQVLADDGEGPHLSGAVCVLVGENAARETDVRNNGDFRFEDVRPGRYALFVESTELRLVVPELDLTSPT